MQCQRCEFWRGRCGWTEEIDPKVCPVGRGVPQVPRAAPAVSVPVLRPVPATSTDPPWYQSIIAVCRTCPAWNGICSEILKADPNQGCQSCQGSVLAWARKGNDCPVARWQSPFKTRGITPNE